MTYDRETLRINDGMDVLGSDNEKVGTVAGMRGDFVVVSKGFFFPTDYYIPTSAIDSTSEDNVYLSVTRDEALNQGWDIEPADTGVVAQEQPIIDAGLHLDNPVPGDRIADDQFIDESARPFDQDADVVAGDLATDTAYVDEAVTDSTYGDELVGDTTRRDHVDVNASDSLRVELAEEELTARTRDVERGAVHVDKVITEEQQTLDVPVTEERVTIDRRVVDRQVAPGEATFEEGTIDVPLRGEEVEIEKRARVREEIEIGKEQVTTSERVTDTVRREEARITGDTDTVIEDIDTIDETGRPIR